MYILKIVALRSGCSGKGRDCGVGQTLFQLYLCHLDPSFLKPQLLPCEEGEEQREMPALPLWGSRRIRYHIYRTGHTA